MKLYLFLCYFLGFALHVLKRANLSAKSPVSQGTRMMEFLTRNWVPIVIRFAACMMIFAGWIEGVADKVLPMVGLQMLMGHLPVPTETTFFNLAAACSIGLFSDWGVDWLIASRFPSAQKELPSIPEGE